MSMSENQFEDELLADVEQFYDDFYGFVMYAFPWKEKGTMLEAFDGPDTWQRDMMLRTCQIIKDDPEASIREAVASGHGIGKSTMVAWIILWQMSTRPHLTGVVTANTTSQLTTKTWRELALWHKLCITNHWFDWSATSFKHKEHPETWLVSAIPNSEHNSEAFAGLHGTYVLVIYDEASGIPDKIWEVSEGAMTTPRAFWFAFGNPTKNTGRFVSCFNEDAERWNTTHIDSRSCKMTNKKEIAEWVKIYGEDSDFIRVRVRGVFPRAGSTQFIPTDIVDIAMHKELEYEIWLHAPIVISADVARFGDDKTVIVVRQGRKIHELLPFRELSTMETASEIGLKIKQYHPVATFVDAVGVGAGVVDRLRMLGYDIIEVNAGSKPDDDETYYNKRAEMWGRMRDWLRQGAEIPYNSDTRKALIGTEYGFDDKERIRLERKADMKKRGEDSPDEGDAIAYSFAEILGDSNMQSFEPDDNFEPEDA